MTNNSEANWFPRPVYFTVGRNIRVPGTRADHRMRKKLCSSNCNKAKEVLTALSGEECVAVTYAIVMLSSPT